MSDSLAARTLLGLKWSYLGRFAGVALQIAFTMALARLLTPADFGLVAMATVVLRFGQYFAQMGVGEAVVQKADLSREDLRTAFTISLLLGLAFFAGFCLAAPLARLLFADTPGVVAVVRWLALGFLLTGLSTTALALLRRRLAFRALAAVEVGSYAFSYGAVAVPLAATGSGVWSLVVAALLQSALAGTAAYALTRHPVVPALFPQSSRRLVAFGGRVSVVGFLEFLDANLDTIAVGRLLGAGALGLYSRAGLLVGLPLEYASTAFTRVLLPSFARLQTDLQRLGGVYASALILFAAVSMPLSWGMAAGGREIVLVVLGPRWAAAIPVFTVICLFPPFVVINHLAGITLEALAHLNVKLLVRGAQLVLLVGLYSWVWRYGLVGFALALGASELAVHAAYLLVMRRLFVLPAGRLLRAYRFGVPAGLATAAVVAGVALAGRAVAAPLPAVLVLEMLAGLVVSAGFVLRFQGGVAWYEVTSRLETAFAPGDAGLGIRLCRWVDKLALHPAATEER